MLYEYNETQNLFLKVVNGKSELKEVNDLLAYFFQCIGLRASISITFSVQSD